MASVGSMFDWMLWLSGVLILISDPVGGLRCYTDVAATKSRSVECGLNTGCVKIFIDSEEMMLKRQQEYGYGYGFPQPTEDLPPLPERYLNNPTLLRACFVLAVPDRCYTAKNGLSYCWCSQKDLCNSANTFKNMLPVTLLLLPLLADIFMRRLLLRTSS